MDLSHAVILGIVQGLTEFFPISSTGHLIIAQKALGFTEISLFFNTVIQMGSILAVLYFYRTKLATLAIRWRESSSQHYVLSLLIATIPILMIGFIFHSLIEWFQQTLYVVIVATLGVAGVMAYIQHKYRSTLENGKKDSDKTRTDYIVTGVFQVLALIPGVSRSGITMLGAITRKFSFADAMETSFLLGIPAMGAASLYEGVKFATSGGPVDQSLLTATAVGFVVAFFTALATISITLPILRKYGFTPFIIYRVILGLALLFFVV